MADIFVSYAREDIERAARIGEFLSARGFNVWWDRELAAGDRFSTVIQDALSKAQAVIVLWSKHSVSSHWVHAEASEALERNILVPLIFDGATPPLEFRKIHSLSFDDWILNTADPAGEELIRALSRRAGASGPVGLTDLSETIVSRLGSRLLSAKTSFELQEGLYELERFLASNPFHTQARMLQARYRAALMTESATHPTSRDVGRVGSKNVVGGFVAAAMVLLGIATLIGLRVFDPPLRGFGDATDTTSRSESVQGLIKDSIALREQGAYDRALTLLEKARKIDPSDPALRAEIEKTTSACNAEKIAGRSELVCEAIPAKDPFK